MEMNKKKYFLYLGMTLLFLIVVVGVSYAAYTFIGTGTTENVITTGQINVSFEEKNNILISNRYPETDTAGLANTDPNSQMTFTVSSDIIGDAIVDYAVGLVDIKEGATLTQEDIKIYLKKNGTTARGFTNGAGKTIESFKDIKIEGFLDSHVIAQGSLTKTKMHTYDLKAWINEAYKLSKEESISDDGNDRFVTTISEEFSFKIKVVATNVQTYLERPTEPETPVLASNMIPVMYDGENWVKADVTNENPDYAWYSYANKQWANAVTVSDYEVSENSATEEAPKAKLLNSSTLTREQLVNLPVGSVIPMERINTMWVWIPRFSAEESIIKLNEQLIEDMAESIVIVYDESKENVIKTIKTSIENNDTDVLSSAYFSHSEVLSLQNISQYINLSDEDKASAITSLGEDAVENYINNNLEFLISDILDTPTSTITITEEMIEKGYEGNAGTYSYLDESEKIYNYIEYILIPYYMEETQNNLYINTNEYNGGTQEAPGTFDITFVGTNEEAHDAFTLGEDELSGFWAGKFETGDTGDYVIKPYIFPLVGQSILDMIDIGLNYQYGFGLKYTEVDTHGMKNNEWAAVTYLTQSMYGRCNSLTECVEVEINNPNNCISAESSNNYEKYSIKLLAALGKSARTGGCDYTSNLNQSTTGNIYGIYDMNGGVGEVVAGGISEVISEIVSYGYDEKYFNSYPLGGISKLPHALYETKMWYSDAYDTSDTENVVLVRGGNYTDLAAAGIFASYYYNGDINNNIGFRMTLANVEEKQSEK